MWKRIFAPFQIIKYEKAYLIWVVSVILFGLLNVWGGVLLTGCSTFFEAIEDGTGYTFAISVCVPQVAEILIKFIVDRRNDREWHLVSYKLIPIWLNILFVVLVTFLWGVMFKDNTIVQLLVVVISIAISFYSYCVNQMEQHTVLVELYDDKKYEYVKSENNKIKELEEKAKSIDTITTRNGVMKL